MELKMINQGPNNAYVIANGVGTQIVKNNIKWPGSFEKVESLVFSPKGDLFACVIESLSQGKKYNLINAERSGTFWDGAHCLYREGVKIGHAKFSQVPVFVGDHYLWIRSRDGYQNISYSSIMCGEACAAISGRGIDEPRRLTIKDDVLQVNGFDGIYDDEKLKHVPFFAVIEYQIKLSSNGLSLAEIKDSYSAWSD
jgi:hypothetical protein